MQASGNEELYWRNQQVCDVHMCVCVLFASRLGFPSLKVAC